MADNKQRAILLRHYNKAVRAPSEMIKFAIEDDDLTTWYVMLFGFTGNHDEFAGGEYLVKIKLPPEFPFKPPEFYFMTPNGVYDIDKEVCINIGSFHASNYPAVLGVAGFCEQLISGMIGWESLGEGINLLDTSIDDKKSMAAASREFNRNVYPTIVDKIESAFKEYSAKWDISKLSAELKTKLGL